MSAVTFTAPMPGLEPLTRFALDELDGVEGLYALRSLENPDIRLFAVDAGTFVPDYAPAAEGLCAAADQTLLVASPHEGGTSVNLMAPILFDRSGASCTQVILDGDRYPVRRSL